MLFQFKQETLPDVSWLKFFNAFVSI